MVSKNGTPVFFGDIAIDDTWKKADSYSQYFKYAIFNEKATKAKELLKKGDTVALTGSIQQRKRIYQSFTYYEAQIMVDQFFRIKRPEIKQKKKVEEQESRITMIGGSSD